MLDAVEDSVDAGAVDRSSSSMSFASFKDRFVPPCRKEEVSEEECEALLDERKRLLDDLGMGVSVSFASCLFWEDLAGLLSRAKQVTGSLTVPVLSRALTSLV